MRSTLTAALATAFVTGNAEANEFEPAIMAYYEAELARLAADPALVTAIRSRNEATSAFSQAQIDGLDLAWRAEVGATDSALIRSVLDGPAADALLAKVDDAAGSISEIFKMDARGLNVAASGLTSDYWQGDEEKFTETFLNGAGAVHVSEVEFDESTHTFQRQVFFTILDPDTQEPPGATTVGLIAEALH